MFNKSIAILTLLLLILPALTQWMPHESLHAVQQHLVEHHAEKNHEHSHYDHEPKSTELQIHPSHLDVVSYYSDYLHVDLKAPDNDFDQILLKESPRSHDYLVLLSKINDIKNLSSNKVFPPPDSGQYLSYNLPLYLSTQRFRL